MMNNEPCFVSRDRDAYELRGSGAERHELKHFESQLAGIETLVFLEFSNSISFQSIQSQVKKIYLYSVLLIALLPLNWSYPMQATKNINNSNDGVIDILIKFVLTFISPIYSSKMPWIFTQHILLQSIRRNQ